MFQILLVEGIQKLNPENKYSQQIYILKMCFIGKHSTYF